MVPGQVALAPEIIKQGLSVRSPPLKDTWPPPLINSILSPSQDYLSGGTRGAGMKEVLYFGIKAFKINNVNAGSDKSF